MEIPLAYSLGILKFQKAGSVISSLSTTAALIGWRMSAVV